MHPATIAGVVALLEQDPALSMATAACPFSNAEELFNPNNVKVVLDDRSRALYFSRSPIPYVRNSTLFLSDFRPWLGPEHMGLFLRHLGIYGYRPEALRAFTALPPHPLERIECLEQLRALAAGMAVGVARTPHLSLGVDVPADIPAVEGLLVMRGARPGGTPSR
jgi:3-deoxy-manno-octulosonate cytidylyltransferase (CMP-KDO synthetase)